MTDFILYEKIIDRLSTTGFSKNPSSGFFESFRKNQLLSKTWLINEIYACQQDLETVAVVGSWNSCLLYELMYDKGFRGRYMFYDIDPEVHIDRKKYFAANDLIVNFDYTEDKISSYIDIPDVYDIVINPSCEHMENMETRPGTLYALMSNNHYNIPEHINCVNSCEELAEKNEINNILYSGQMILDNYSRYLVIGEKNV